MTNLTSAQSLFINNLQSPSFCFSDHIVDKNLNFKEATWLGHVVVWLSQLFFGSDSDYDETATMTAVAEAVDKWSETGPLKNVSPEAAKAMVIHLVGLGIDWKKEKNMKLTEDLYIVAKGAPEKSDWVSCIEQIVCVPKQKRESLFEGATKVKERVARFASIDTLPDEQKQVVKEEMEKAIVAAIKQINIDGNRNFIIVLDGKEYAGATAGEEVFAALEQYSQLSSLEKYILLEQLQQGLLAPALKDALFLIPEIEGQIKKPEGYALCVQDIGGYARIAVTISKEKEILVKGSISLGLSMRNGSDYTKETLFALNYDIMVDLKENVQSMGRQFVRKYQTQEDAASVDTLLKFVASGEEFTQKEKKIILPILGKFSISDRLAGNKNWMRESLRQDLAACAEEVSSKEERQVFREIFTKLQKGAVTDAERAAFREIFSGLDYADVSGVLGMLAPSKSFNKEESALLQPIISAWGIFTESLPEEDTTILRNILKRQLEKNEKNQSNLVSQIIAKLSQ